MFSMKRRGPVLLVFFGTVLCVEAVASEGLPQQYVVAQDVFEHTPSAEGEDVPLAGGGVLPVAVGAEQGNGVLPEKKEGEAVQGVVVVTGVVSDSSTGAVLGGVGISVEGLDVWTSTDKHGRFSLRGVPVGKHSLLFTNLGFETRMKEVEVRQGAVVNVRMMMDPKRDVGDDEYMMDDYDVVADYQEEEAAAVILGAAEGGVIGSGLGKEEFATSGISDAAEAVGKISGANIVGGKYAVIRGLGDRYSNTTVNGALISSADPSRKAVQLDLFPSHLLQSVMVYKTFTPNLPGEFSGGLVAMETLRMPQERILDVKLGGKAYENVLGSNFYVNPDGGLGFLGQRPDGLPVELANRPLKTGDVSFNVKRDPVTGRPVRDPVTRRPVFIPGNPELVEETEKQWSALHQSAGLRPKKAKPIEYAPSLSLTYGDTFKLGGDARLGAVFAFTRSNKDTVVEGVRLGREVDAGPDGLPNTADDSLNRTQVEDRYNRSVDYGFLSALTYQLNDRHEVGFLYFKNHVAEDRVTRGRRIVDDETQATGKYLPSSANHFGAGAYYYLAFDKIAPLYRDLDIYQLHGKHYLGEKDRSARIDWLWSRTVAEEARPHSRTTFLNELDFADPRILDRVGSGFYDPSRGASVTTLADYSGDAPPPTQTFRESQNTTEKSVNGLLGLTLPYYFEKEGDDRFELGLGVNWLDKKRRVRGREFQYSVSNSFNNYLRDGLTSGERRAGGTPDPTFGEHYANGINSVTDPNGNYIFDGWTSSRNSNETAYTLTELSANTNDTDAFTELTAFYFFPALYYDKWTLTGGARYEKEVRGYTEQENQRRSDEVENDHILPALAIQRTFGSEDQHSLAVAWSRTVARPIFYEFAAFQTTDQASGETVSGAAFNGVTLEDTLITNYDLRWDWMLGKDELFSFNLFYKDMDKPITEILDGRQKTWVNGLSGELRGLEIEFAKQVAESWSIRANYTYIDSLLEYEQNGQRIESTYDGQPEHIFNLNLGYANEEHRYSVNLVYNFTGSYLVTVPPDANISGVRRRARHSLDLIAKKDFSVFGSDATVTLEVGNLLDAPMEFEYEGVGFYESYNPGRSIKLSMKMSF